MTRSDALFMATSQELDLVEVSPMAEPPVVRIMALPEVQKSLTSKSVVTLTSKPEEFAKLIASEIQMWKKVAEDNNIKPN